MFSINVPKRKKRIIRLFYFHLKEERSEDLKQYLEIINDENTGNKMQIT
jgi:hypothetical protein